MASPAVSSTVCSSAYIPTTFFSSFQQALAQTNTATTVSNYLCWASSTNATQVQISALANSSYGGSGDPIYLPENWEGLIKLPDGARLLGHRQPDTGHHVIDLLDANDKVKYRAAILDFNRYLNGSDLVEEFIRFSGAAGAKQHEVLDLPISLFIGFLMIRAAEADGEPRPQDVVFEIPPRRRARCVGCGRFIMPRSHVTACSGAHLDRYLARLPHRPLELVKGKSC